MRLGVNLSERAAQSKSCVVPYCVLVIDFDCVSVIGIVNGVELIPTHEVKKLAIKGIVKNRKAIKRAYLTIANLGVFVYPLEFISHTIYKCIGYHCHILRGTVVIVESVLYIGYIFVTGIAYGFTANIAAVGICYYFTVIGNYMVTFL